MRYPNLGGPMSLLCFSCTALALAVAVGFGAGAVSVLWLTHGGAQPRDSNTIISEAP